MSLMKGKCPICHTKQEVVAGKSGRLVLITHESGESESVACRGSGISVNDKHHKRSA